MLNALLTPSLATPSTPLPKLTSRQHQLWTLMATGYTNQAMAQKLGLSIKWVDSAIGQLYGALAIDTADRAQNPRVCAVLLYIHLSTNVSDSRGSLRTWSEASN